MVLSVCMPWCKVGNFCGIDLIIIISGLAISREMARSLQSKCDLNVSDGSAGRG